MREMGFLTKLAEEGKGECQICRQIKKHEEFFLIPIEESWSDEHESYTGWSYACGHHKGVVEHADLDIMAEILEVN